MVRGREKEVDVGRVGDGVGAGVDEEAVGRRWAGRWAGAR